MITVLKQSPMAVAFVAFVLLTVVLESWNLITGLLLWNQNKFMAKKLLTSWFSITLHLIAMAGLGCFLYGLLIEPYRLSVNTVRLETDKLQQTHLKIVQISDLHCSHKTRLEPILPQIINALKPDIVVFTGDAANTKEAAPLFQKTLTAIEASIGKFAVRGNWDFRPGYTAGLFDETGFTELPLTVRYLEKQGESFTLAGVSFINAGRFNRLDPLPAETFNILLHHTPDLIEQTDDKNIDLYLCGHTHGGQVALPFYGALVTLSKYGKKYESGLNHYKNTQIYTNRGIGMDGIAAPPVRFFARPEITVFEIGPKN